MPKIEEYISLAPFSLDELVNACNSILRDKPAMAVQSRTVRYYISTGLLLAPKGGPKYARYDVEHLRRLVAIRQWLDEGSSLEDAALRLQRGEHGGDLNLDVTFQNKKPGSRVDESESIWSPHSLNRDAVFSQGSKNMSLYNAKNERKEKVVHRIKLTPHSVLEVEADSLSEAELRRAMDSMIEYFKNF